MDLDWALLKRHLPKAIAGGLVLGFLIMVVLVNFYPPPTKQSHRYWTEEARPFHINDQYMNEGDLIWTLELVNGEAEAIDLFGIDVGGNGTSTHWEIARASRFEAGVGKLMLIPMQKPCRQNDTYAYSLNITYARAGQAKEIEVGKYPVFGRCG